VLQVLLVTAAMVEVAITLTEVMLPQQVATCSQEDSMCLVTAKMATIDEAIIKQATTRMVNTLLSITFVERKPVH